MKCSRGAHLVYNNIASRKTKVIQDISVMVHEHTMNSCFPDSSRQPSFAAKGSACCVVWAQISRP